MIGDDEIRARLQGPVNSLPTVFTRQGEIEEKFDKEYKLPVFYFTQLLGLALGVPVQELGIDKHLVSAEELIGASTQEVKT